MGGITVSNDFFLYLTLKKNEQYETIPKSLKVARLKIKSKLVFGKKNYY